MNQYVPTPASHFGGLFDVRTFGAVGDGVNDDTAAIQRTIDAADLAGGGIVHLPIPDVEWTSETMNFAGKEAVVRGMGHQSAVRHLPGSTRPLLDLTDWVGPRRGIGSQRFSDFRLLGNGEPTEPALIFTEVTAGQQSRTAGSKFYGVTTDEQGGPGWHFRNTWGHTFFDCVAGRPVNGDSTDNPYFLTEGWVSGSRWIGFGMRNDLNAVDPLDCFLMVDDKYDSHDNTWSGCWYEYLNIKENGSVYNLRVTRSQIEMPQAFDTEGNTPNQTNSCVVRLSSPINTTPMGNTGGNTVWGAIPGRNTNPNRLAYGVIVEQPYNRITGTRGFVGNVVKLEPGVRDTFVEIGGQHAGGTPVKAVKDASNNSTNSVLDYAYGEMVFKAGMKFTMWDANGTRRTLSQPNGQGPAEWE